MFRRKPPRVVPSAVIQEGWLQKSSKPGVMKKGQWRRKYFVLRESPTRAGQYVLEYYSSADCKKLKGRIELSECGNVRRDGLAGLEIHIPARVYRLKGETEDDASRWHAMLGQVCGFARNEDRRRDRGGDDEEEDESPYIPLSECIVGSAGTEMFRYDEEAIKRMGQRPPAVDRNLKPRSAATPLLGPSSARLPPLSAPPPGKAEELQYATLDLSDSRRCAEEDYYYTSLPLSMPTSAPPVVEESTSTVYKTVDFVKTLALQETRKQWCGEGGEQQQQPN